MKTKFIFTFFLLAGLHQMTFGQVTEGEAKLRAQNTDTVQGWKKGGVVAVSLAQTSLTNWSAGGENSFSINGLFSVFANYHRDKTVWDNSLDVGYGFLKQGENSDYMKTDDRFDLLSKYGRQAFKNFYYSALVNFKTQMAEGLDYKKDTSKISNFLAPAYFIVAVGMDYKPNNNFSAFVAPLTGRITIVNDQQLADAGAFGVTKATYDNLGNVLTNGKRLRSEFGGYVRVIYTRNDFKDEILKNVSFTTKADFFSNYLKNPQYIDVNWETQIALKVNNYISVNLNTHLLYDHAIVNVVNGISAPHVQFKEILGVGLTYRF